MVDCNGFKLNFLIYIFNRYSIPNPDIGIILNGDNLQQKCIKFENNSM